MKRLENKIVLVTGGAQGMGAATSRVCAREGAQVIIADVAEAPGRALASELGKSASYVALNVAKEAEWQAVVGDALQRYGRIDALVNNAAVVHFGDIDSLSEADFDRVWNVNVKGCLLGMKHVGRAMRAARRGSIVNISSVDGLRGVNGLAAYSCSKWAVRGLTRSAALEYGPYNVRVNSVHPGGVDTQMGNPQQLDRALINRDYRRVPLQRIGDPEEIAKVSVFLCSDDSSYMSGAEVAVDGGWAAGWYHDMLPGGPPRAV